MSMDRYRIRIWDKGRKRMSYNEDGWSGSYGTISLIDVYTGYEDSDEWEDYVLMACTGLKDSEGNLIYEGDILTTEDAPLCSIRWCERGGGFEFYVYENGEQHESHMHFTGHDADTGKVLGNIYEHPSLLEAER